LRELIFGGAVGSRHQVERVFRRGFADHVARRELPKTRHDFGLRHLTEDLTELDRECRLHRFSVATMRFEESAARTAVAAPA